MSRTPISLPDELFEELDGHRDDRQWPEFFREVVLPLLRDDVELTDQDAAAIEDAVERIEGRLDDLEAQLPAETAKQVEHRLH
jgi:metal-responsive CopG/Arc/MetJ family transcriptional regulator